MRLVLVTVHNSFEITFTPKFFDAVMFLRYCLHKAETFQPKSSVSFCTSLLHLWLPYVADAYTIVLLPTTKARFPALRTQHTQSKILRKVDRRIQRKQRKVENTPRKRNRTCSNFTQATQEVANGIAGICHVCVIALRTLRALRYMLVACVRLETALNAQYT